MTSGVNLPIWMDQYKASRMVQLRALGYTQSEIAEQLGISQQTVSKYLAEVNKKARSAKDPVEFLWALLMIGAGVALLGTLLRSLQGGGSR